MFTKFANHEQILEVKTSSSKLEYSPVEGEMLSKFAKTKSEPEVEDGYVYVRTRAISSRVNKNNDGWPSSELAKAYKTFIGRPIFVDHNNDDPRRARGVIVDAKLHVEEEKTSSLDPYYSSAPDNHKPETWVELLMEVDGKTYPKLGRAIKNGDIDATSMGANIDMSVCSVCANEATVPSEYCNHIKSKGATFEVTADNGEKIQKKAYEDCYGVNFFEDSFVFDPADETALNIEVSESKPRTAKVAADETNLPDLDENQKAELAQDIAQFESGTVPAPQGILSKLVDAYNTPYKGETGLFITAFLGVLAHHYGIPHMGSYKYAHLIQPVAADDDDKRVLNTIPQDDMVKSPQKVDTLRSDVKCPNCEADVLETDPDGIQKCPTCGYSQPPEGLDSPDLGRARELDKEETLDQGQSPDGAQGGGDVVQAEDSDAADDTHFIKPLGHTSSIASLFLPRYSNQWIKKEGDQWVIIQKGTGKVLSHHDSEEEAEAAFRAMMANKHGANGATNSHVPTGVISEMNWKTKVATNSASEANVALRQVTAGAVQTQIEFKGGIHFGTHAALKAAGLTGTVLYPGAPGPLPLGEGANPMQHFMYQMQAVKAEGLSDPGQLTVTVEAPDNELDHVLQIIHSGGGHADVGAQQPVAATKTPAAKTIALPGTEQTPEAGSKIVSDQLAPITSDRRVIKREETPDGHRTEQIIEETGGFGDDLEEGKEDKPKEDAPENDEGSSEEGKEESGDSKKPDFLNKDKKDDKPETDPQKKLLAAFSLAEEAVDMGILSKDKKLAFVGQLEHETEEQIEARRQTLVLVKSAGLTSRKVVASRGSSFPRLGSGSAIGSSKALDDIPFEAIFLS